MFSICPTMSEKLWLKWDDFQESINKSFTNLRQDETFSDVTLVCEDGQKIEAHKVILSASSPFFLKLLKENKHPHPLVFMRGVTSKVLEAMMDFFYNGEANVCQDSLDDFLSLAGELELRGLSCQPHSWQQRPAVHSTDILIWQLPTTFIAM